jgi:antitoxin VapB
MAKVKTPVVAYQAASPTRPTRRDAVGAEQRAKLFANGRSQAVRLPKDFRMPGTEVSIRREGSRIILEPLEECSLDAKGWPCDLWKWFDEFDADFPDPEPMSLALQDPETEQP